MLKNNTIVSFDQVFKDGEEGKPVAIKKEKLEIIHEPKLNYNSKYSFSEYRNAGKYMDDSFESQCNRLTKFYNGLNEFKKFTFRTVNTKEEMKTVYKNAKNLFNNLLSIFYNDYIDIPDEEKKKMSEKYNPSNLLIKCLTFIESKKEDKETNKSQAAETIAERVKLRKQKSDDDDSDEFINISDMPPR